MKENEYYQKGYNLGKLRAKDLTNSEDNSRQVSEMMDNLMYQSDSFKIFTIGFIHGFNEAQKQPQTTKREYDLGYDLGYRIGFTKPFPQEESEWVEQALQTIQAENLDNTVFNNALYKGIEDGKRDDADTRD